MSRDFVTLQTFRFLPEAEAARLYLENGGLHAILTDAEIVNMDWLLGNAVGNIKLQVPNDEAERAVELLREAEAFRAAQKHDDRTDDENDDEDSTDSVCLACGATMHENETHCSHCGWSFEGGTSD